MITASREATSQKCLGFRLAGDSEKIGGRPFECGPVSQLHIEFPEPTVRW